ncbi:hypothetical protein Y032_0048g1720 [Ancylostoma ceylanicum]|nr:hypothetical protein Y032_0048g1720 [Ancylostoma ceylanicum]
MSAAIKRSQRKRIKGASTKGGAFTKEIIQEMAKNNERPIIFALSNPTKNSECTAEQAFKLTNGKVLFASGSPFENVEINGKIYKPGQGNNAYIFPGISLGCVLFKAKHIPDKLFLLAARRVAASVSEKSLYKYCRLYPRLKNIREISVQIAMEVGNYLYHHNLATLHPEPDDMVRFLSLSVYPNVEVYMCAVRMCVSVADAEKKFSHKELPEYSLLTSRISCFNSNPKLQEMYIRMNVYSTDYTDVINKPYEWPPQDSKQGFPVPLLERMSMEDE